MLTHQGGAADGDLALGHSRSPAQQPDRAVIGMLELVNEATAREMLVGEEVHGIEDRAARHPGRAQDRHHLPLRALLRPRGDFTGEGVRLLRSPHFAFEAGIADEVRPAHGVAERRPHARRAGHDVGIVVRPERCAGVEVDQRAVAAGGPWSNGPAPVRTNRDPGAHVVGHRFLHRDLDQLPFAGALLLHVGAQQRQRQLHARSGIAHGGPRHRRRAVGIPGDGECASGGLRHHVVALVAGVGAGGAEAFEPRIDDVGMDGTDHVVVDAQLLNDAGAVVLHEDVVVRRHLEQQLPPSRLAQIEHNTALVAVPVQEIRRVPVPLPSTPPGVPVFGGLDLDDVGAHPGQRLRARCAPPRIASYPGFASHPAPACVLLSIGAIEPHAIARFRERVDAPARSPDGAGSRRSARSAERSVRWS